MKILLTGSTGFIGSNVLSALLDRQFEVIASVRSVSHGKLTIKHKNLLSVEGDFWAAASGAVDSGGFAVF